VRFWLLDPGGFQRCFIVIAGGAGGQQEGLQYNGEAAWWKVIGVYIISADEKKLKLALPKRS
jgi:hypothetical protein